MNRPTIYDFEFIEGGFDYEVYSKELDKYCDELEKALDKACERLRDFDEMEQLNHGLKRPRDIEEWKEWTLGDENF